MRSLFQTKSERELTAAQKRIRALGTKDLEDYAQGQMYEIGRAMSAFSQRRGTDDLAFALDASRHLTAMLEEIYNRLEG